MSMRSWSLFLHSGCRRTLLSCNASIRQDISGRWERKTNVKYANTLWKVSILCVNASKLIHLHESVQTRETTKMWIKWVNESTHVFLCREWWQHSGVWGPERRLCGGPGPQRCPPYSPSACSGLPAHKKKKWKNNFYSNQRQMFFGLNHQNSF